MRVRWAYKIVPTVIVSTVIASLFCGRFTDSTARYQLDGAAIRIGGNGQVSGNGDNRQSLHSNSRPSVTGKQPHIEMQPTIALSGLQVEENLNQRDFDQAALSDLSRKPRRISSQMAESWQLSSLPVEGSSPVDTSKERYPLGGFESPVTSPSQSDKSGSFSTPQQFIRPTTAPASEFSHQSTSPAITRLPTEAVTRVRAELAKSRQVIAERAIELNSNQATPDSVEMEYSNGHVIVPPLAQSSQFPSGPPPNPDSLIPDVPVSVPAQVASSSEAPIASTDGQRTVSAENMARRASEHVEFFQPELEFSNGQVYASPLAQYHQFSGSPPPNPDPLVPDVPDNVPAQVASLPKPLIASKAGQLKHFSIVSAEAITSQADKHTESVQPETEAGNDLPVANDSQPDEAAEAVDQEAADESDSPDAPQVTNPQSDIAEHMELDPKAFWWKQELGSPLVDTDNAESIGLDELLMIALQNSPQILAISQEPLVEELEVVKSESRFDPEMFLRTKYDDRTDPVGNALTTGTGGPQFLRDHIWSGDSGVRKKLMTGGAIDLKQNLGFQNSNSLLFQPQDQGTATLSLNYSQPLLKGAGRMYSESKILLAQTFSAAAWQKYYSELQDELLRVAEAYWRLYYFRSVLLQKHHSLQRGEEILLKLEARSGLDSLPSQIARARAAVESRRTELANAVRDVKNSETEIRKLIAQPNWFSAQNIEMIPSDPPRYDHVDYQVDQVVETALDFRPEIKHSLDRAKAAAIEFKVSRNELLPELSMLFGTYVAGLEGNSNIGRAWTEQFTNTTPGYYAGIEYKIPRGNRAAKSEYEQRRLRLAKIRYEVDVVVQDVIADSQVALRRVNSAYRTLQSSVSAIEAANADLRYNQSRWEAFALVEGDFAERQNPTTLLDQLLEAQQRLTNEEIRFAQAELEFKNSQFYLKRAMGTLLQTVPVKSN